MSDTPPNTNPQPQTPAVPSPLGTDPVESAPIAETTAPTTAPPIASQPRGVDDDSIRLDKATYNQMLENANAYGMIVNDPVIAGQVMDHFRAKTGQVAPSVRPTELPQSSKELDQLRNTTQTLVNRLAQMEIESFRREHPDMNEHVDTMKVLVSQHNMDLPTAYKFAKLAKQQQSNTTSSPAPAEPVVEGKQSGAVSSADPFADLERQINDPKAAPRIEDAVKLAWKLASQKAGTQS